MRISASTSILSDFNQKWTITTFCKNIYLSNRRLTTFFSLSLSFSIVNQRFNQMPTISSGWECRFLRYLFSYIIMLSFIKLSIWVDEMINCPILSTLRIFSTLLITKLNNNSVLKNMFGVILVLFCLQGTFGRYVQDLPNNCGYQVLSYFLKL